MNEDVRLKLEALEEELSVCKFDELPRGIFDESPCFFARTADELSVVCRTDRVPDGAMAREDGWRAFKVVGPLDFGLVGILARISSALAQAGVPIYAVSTFDTDYVLVKAEKLAASAAALRDAGCEVVE